MDKTGKFVVAEEITAGKGQMRTSARLLFDTEKEANDFIMERNAIAAKKGWKVSYRLVGQRAR